MALVASLTLTQMIAGTGRGSGLFREQGEGEAGMTPSPFEANLREDSASILSAKEELHLEPADIPEDSPPSEIPERLDIVFDPFARSPVEGSCEAPKTREERVFYRRPSSAFDRLPAGEAGRTGEAVDRPVGPQPGLSNTPSSPMPGPGASGVGTGTGGSGDGILVAVYAPKPDYPLVARRRRIEGVVVLELTVEPSGIVSGAIVVESSGCDALDRSALEKVRHWIYERKPGGSPAAALFQRVRCVFRLDP